VDYFGFFERDLPGSVLRPMYLKKQQLIHSYKFPRLQEHPVENRHRDVGQKFGDQNGGSNEHKCPKNKKVVYLLQLDKLTLYQ
jgi:hypothetical protein